MSQFEPSNHSYGAVDPALVSQLISSGTTIASSAVSRIGTKPGAGKRRHKAKMEEIAAAEPDHSPMWPIALGLGGGALILGYILTRPAPVPARAVS